MDLWGPWRHAKRRKRKVRQKARISGIADAREISSLPLQPISDNGAGNCRGVHMQGG